VPPHDECVINLRELWRYLDGGLPDMLRVQVAELLATCTDCRSHFDFARLLLVAIREHGQLDDGFDAQALELRVLGALAAAKG
jgi:anti-sigma factor RsiW